MSHLTQTETITLQCRLNPRLGALDRVLGVLSHQGILPLSLNATMVAKPSQAGADNSLASVMNVTFVLPPCDPQVMAKRVKLIEKQIDVICCELK